MEQLDEVIVIDIYIYIYIYICITHEGIYTYPPGRDMLKRGTERNRCGIFRKILKHGTGSGQRNECENESAGKAISRLV